MESLLDTVDIWERGKVVLVGQFILIGVREFYTLIINKKGEHNEWNKKNKRKNKPIVN